MKSMEFDVFNIRLGEFDSEGVSGIKVLIGFAESADASMRADVSVEMDATLNFDSTGHELHEFAKGAALEKLRAAIALLESHSVAELRSLATKNEEASELIRVASLQESIVTGLK